MTPPLLCGEEWRKLTMKKIKLRFLSALMAVMLCVTAFSVPALAYGGEETTGGLEPETEETGTADTTDGTEADTDAAALQQALRNLGYEDAVAQAAQPDIEDCFMALAAK